MSLAVFNGIASIPDGNGFIKIAASATVTVRRESDNALATIYSDAAGATLLGNPFTADSSGRITFYAAGLTGGYKVHVAKNGLEHEDRNVAIGTAAQLDTADVSASLGFSAYSQTLIDDADASAWFTTHAGSLGTPAADRLIYASGAAAWALAPLTSFGRSLIDDADAVTARATLGLVIGTNVQAFDATLSAFAALTITANSLTLGTGADAFSQIAFAANTFPARSSTGNLAAKALSDFALTVLDDANANAAKQTLQVGVVAQNSQSAAYTLVLADQGKHILHPAADNNARTFTIPANSSVAFPVGTAVTFANEINTVTIAITTDTLVLAGDGSTGSRTLAANGIATALKITSTKWIISGTGLS